MAVIAPKGVVGRVIGPVAAHAARVQLIIDRNAAAGAVDRTDARRRHGRRRRRAIRRCGMELVSNLADVKRGRRRRRLRRRRDLSEGLRHRLGRDRRSAGRGPLSRRSRCGRRSTSRASRRCWSCWCPRAARRREDRRPWRARARSEGSRRARRAGRGAGAADDAGGLSLGGGDRPSTWCWSRSCTWRWRSAR